MHLYAPKSDMKRKTLAATAVLLILAICCKAQTSYTLKEALNTAAQHNPDLIVNAYNKDIAQSDIISAGLRPNLSLNNQSLQLLDGSRQAPGTPWYNNHNRQVWWQLTKHVQWPGQRQDKLDLARKTYAVADKDFQESKRNIYFETANRWLDAWNVKARLQTLVEAQSNLDTLVEINSIRLKNQVINQTELIRTQLLSEQYNLQLKQIRQDYRVRLYSLRYSLGTGDSVDIDLNGSIESFSFGPSLDSIFTYAFRNRTDLQSAQLSMDAAKSNIKLQKALRFPQPELGFIYNPQNAVPYFGVFGTIELPFWSHNQGEIRKSYFIQQQAEQSVKNTELKVKNESQSAYEAYLVQKETLERYKTILDKTDQVLRNVKYSYLKGGTTILDLIDAQRSWYDTRELYYDAQLNYHKSYIQLLYTTGLINQL
jgi:cobalt-zinc-cadmium efflux system outer membrane protein